MHSTLQLVLILLATAVIVVVVFRVLRLPPLLGYLLVGIAIGPHALGWIPDTAGTRYLAEFGVVFLMFSIGLEFSLPKLATMRRIVFGFGAAQVVATIAIVVSIGVALGLDWRGALALGGVFAMSSTAIVSKMLADRLELDSQHGRQVIGVLLFQDLAVVPLLILIPALAFQMNLGAALGLALLKAALVLAIVLFFGQRIMRSWFHLVARQKSAELFMLNILLITLGLAYLTDLAGLSLALGAFLAGMLISETEYRYRVEDDIKPFRDVLLGLFFVTVGMLLDIRAVFDNLLWVALVLVALIVFKLLLIAGLARLFGADSATALRTGMNLAQGGEFGFVLLSQLDNLQLVSVPALQIVLAALLLSMLAAPFIIEHSEHMVRRFSAAEWMNRAMQLHNIAVQTMAIEGHVIICGFGRSGQSLARLLEQEDTEFIALDLDPRRIREASAAGEHVVYGDAAKREVLVAAGLMRAAALVIAYSDLPSALRILAHVQELRPDLPVVVRTIDDADLDRLKEAGAAEVVSEIREGSLMLATHALMLVGLPLNRVLARIRTTREQRYTLFRGFFHGTTDEAVGKVAEQSPQLHSIIITPGAASIGKSIGELRLTELGVDVTAVRRRNVRNVAPASDTQLEVSDVLVLRGVTEGLAAAEIRLLQG
ncbi:MAG: monovalent cation:proton antiporter-2 (CPA2) family protein [Pseudomonadota bacterium]|nr:monovalent cation:proton antiporter-2 (CPA2) family protein [Pseudomonadota bacterium]